MSAGARRRRTAPSQVGDEGWGLGVGAGAWGVGRLTYLAVGTLSLRVYRITRKITPSPTMNFRADFVQTQAGVHSECGRFGKISGSFLRRIIRRSYSSRSRGMQPRMLVDGVCHLLCCTGIPPSGAISPIYRGYCRGLMPIKCANRPFLVESLRVRAHAKWCMLLSCRGSRWRRRLTS